MIRHLGIVVEGQISAVEGFGFRCGLGARGAYRRQLEVGHSQQGREVGALAPAVVGVGPDDSHANFVGHGNSSFNERLGLKVLWIPAAAGNDDYYQAWAAGAMRVCQSVACS